MKSRFGGIARLYGEPALQIFQQSHVLIIGIGGVGSWVAEALARSGIGKISLMDMDDICVTNINRQIHALSDNIGELKTEVMAQRLQQINPDIKVAIIDDFLTVENCRSLIGESYDYIFDAIDAVKPKAQLIYHCRRNKIPLLCCGAAGGQIDPSKVTIADLSRTFNDALSAKTRSWLRRQYHYSKNPKRKLDVEVVFSTEQPRFPKSDGSVCYTKSETEDGLKMDCTSGFGSSTAVTATFGMLAAGKILTNLAS